jgi:hypothetical protein
LAVLIQEALDMVTGSDTAVPGGIEFEMNGKGVGLGGIGAGVGMEGEDGVQASVVEGLTGILSFGGVGREALDGAVAFEIEEEAPVFGGQGAVDQEA